MANIKIRRSKRVVAEEISATALRSQRLVLKLSQSELDQQAGVSHSKTCIYELGGAARTADEQRLIREALEREAEPSSNFDQPERATAAPVEV